MVERLNQTIENFLVKHEMKDTDWSKLVSSACFAYHMHMHKATGYTPARLFLGWDLVPPIVQAYEGSPIESNFCPEKSDFCGCENSETFNTQPMGLKQHANNAKTCQN